MEQEYIYAVARIKARELSLLTQQDLDRLIFRLRICFYLRFLLLECIATVEELK